jgi:hypothetical protein
MANPDITKIPAPRTPVIDENTGDMTPAWYRFFYNLFGFTGSGGDGGVPVNRGGTGQTSYTDGQLLIGNSIGNTLSKNTLTPGTGIGVTNGHGTIEIDNTGVTSIAAGAGISVSGATGAVTVANTGVLSFNADSTGLTPATSTTGDVTLSGTLNTTHGGTGAAGTLTGYVKGNGASPMSASPTVPWAEVSAMPHIEAYDTSASIALTSTPTLLTPASTAAGSSGITYNSSTGVFTFAAEGTYSLSLNVNATSTAANQFVYIYAENNTGSGWVVNANSGKTYELTNANTVQIVYSQAVYRVAGQQVRYYIYSNDGKVSLITAALPGGVGAQVPAIRIQYAG